MKLRVLPLEPDGGHIRLADCVCRAVQAAHVSVSSTKHTCIYAFIGVFSKGNVKKSLPGYIAASVMLVILVFVAALYVFTRYVHLFRP